MHGPQRLQPIAVGQKHLTLHLSGLLFIRDGIGCAHHIVGIGVISQGEAGAGARHLMPVQRQHVHRFKGLIVNQSHLLLTDSTACRSLPVQTVLRLAVKSDQDKEMACATMGLCMPCIYAYMSSKVELPRFTIDACAHAPTHNALLQQDDMKQQGCTSYLKALRRW